jgi:hypothetical protein
MSMSLESCPKCRYALPIGNYRCRHCGAILRDAPVPKPLNASEVMVWTSVVLAVVFFFGGLYGDRQRHRYAGTPKPSRPPAARYTRSLLAMSRLMPQRRFK